MTLDILGPDGGVRCKGATLEITRYAYGGGIALSAVCRDGEPWGVLTVNLVGEDTGKDCVFVKDYSEGAGNVRTLAAASLIETPPVRWARSGFVEIPLCRLTEKGMQLVREFDAKASCKTRFAVRDRVEWDDPDGERPCGGWTVIQVPELDDDGNEPEDGIYVIARGDGSTAEVHADELKKEGGHV